MPWNNNGKGKPSPWGSSPKPPKQPHNIDDVFKKGSEKFNDFFGGSGPRSWGIAAIVIFVLWLASGFIKIDANEQGIVLRFGAMSRSFAHGLNYHLPYPFEKVIKVPVTVVNRVEVGGGSSSDRTGAAPAMSDEGLMLTGDENIANIQFDVQWKINNAEYFVFNVREPEATVKNVAESAMREVIGKTPISDAISEGRFRIQQETEELIQQILDNYKSGILITDLLLRPVEPPTAVIDAFRDVQTAKADQQRLRNEAEAYRNDIIPRARGLAEQMVQDAEAYKQEVIAHAQGQAQRFESVLDKYRAAKDVTKRRMYLETLEQILKGTQKVIIDNKAQGSGVLPYLPLPALENKARTAP